MSMKIWKTIIQQRKKLSILFYEMIAGMEANERLSTIVNELFLRGRKNNISHILYHNPISSYLKL